MKIQTSYISKINSIKEQGKLPVGIVRYVPHNLQLFNIQELAPDSSTLLAFKQTGCKENFIKSYEETLSKVNTESIKRLLENYSKVNGEKDIVIVCYEKTGAFCHRHLLAKWLVKNGIVDSVEEF